MAGLPISGRRLSHVLSNPVNSRICLPNGLARPMRADGSSGAGMRPIKVRKTYSRSAASYSSRISSPSSAFKDSILALSASASTESDPVRMYASTRLKKARSSSVSSPWRSIHVPKFSISSGSCKWWTTCAWSSRIAYWSV